MAKPVLPTNFQDDIMNASMNGKRKYTLIQNTDGTVSLEDVTEYDQVGSNFGAGQINQTNTAVNESADKGKIIDDLGTISAVTEEGYIAGALAVKEINSNIENLGGFTPVIDSTGKITGYKTEAGADTVFPFSSLIDLPKKIKVASKSITTTTGSGKRTVSVADIIPSNGYIIGFQQVQAISYTLRYSYDAINRTISYDGKVGSVTNFIVWINYIVF